MTLTPPNISVAPSPPSPSCPCTPLSHPPTPTHPPTETHTHTHTHMHTHLHNLSILAKSPDPIPARLPLPNLHSCTICLLRTPLIQRPELHQAFDSTMAAVRAKEERLDRGWAERHRLKEQADARIRVQQQELAHLREEGRACDLAYQGERHTHSALVAQAQMRDATLRAEGAAYENALTQMQRQVAAKEAEWVQLEQRMEACAGEAQSRRQRLQELQRELQAEEQAVRERAGHGSRRGEGSRHSGVAEGDGAEQGGEAVVEGANQVMGEEGIRKDQSGGEGADAGSRLGREGAGVVSSSWGGGQGHGEGSRGRGVEESRGRGEVGPGEREPGEDGGMGWSPRGGDSSQRREQEAGVLLQELERLRRHEVQLDKSIDQVEAVLHTYTKGDGWPSAGERLAELDRRLRALKEQLLAKKSQAEALDSEKLRLQQQLHHILSSQGASGDHRLHSALKRSRVQAMGHAATATGGNQGRGEMQERMLEVAKKMDVLGLRAGHHLWNNMPLRAAVILYVLLLHLIVFIIIAVDAMRG
eukprot:jgi/Mesvir1/19132/Mv12870-RA.3